MSMLAAPRNRSRFKVDNPHDGDGFYTYLRPKARDRAAKGTRLRRRALRLRENRAWKADISAR